MTETPESKESFWQRIQRQSSNVLASTKAKSVNVKESAIIKKLRYDIQQRKKIFGIDYLTLLKETEGTTAEDLQNCIDAALSDIDKIQEEITEHEKTISNTQESLQLKIQQNAGGPLPEGAPEPIMEPPPLPSDKPELVGASEL